MNKSEIHELKSKDIEENIKINDYIYNLHMSIYEKLNKEEKIVFNATLEAVERSIKEVEELHQRIDRTLNDINLVIEIIKSQPAENDDWFLNRLYGFKALLGNKGK